MYKQINMIQKQHCFFTETGQKIEKKSMQKLHFNSYTEHPHKVVFSLVMF